VDPTLPSGAKKQVEFAKSGEDVALTRTVLSNDRKVVRQATFNTHYQAWPNKFLISKDTAAVKTVKATTAPNTPPEDESAGPTDQARTITHNAGNAAREAACHTRSDEKP
jgi:hypothetical protein